MLPSRQSNNTAHQPKGNQSITKQTNSTKETANPPRQVTSHTENALLEQGAEESGDDYVNKQQTDMQWFLLRFLALFSLLLLGVGVVLAFITHSSLLGLIPAPLIATLLVPVVRHFFPQQTKKQTILVIRDPRSEQHTAVTIAGKSIGEGESSSYN